MASIKYSAELDTTKLDASIKQSNKTIGDYAKNVEKAGGQMDKTFDKTTKSLKEAVAIQKALVKELEADVKNLEKAYKNMTPGTQAQKAARVLGDTKAYLAQEQERLIQLQQEQIEVNKREEESAQSLQGMIGKWALSLGGAAAALGMLKKAFGETTQGMNLFNTVGAITQQILHDIVSGAGLSMTRLVESARIQQQLNALREEEYISAFRAAKYNNEYQKLYAESIDTTLSNGERLEKVNDALDTHNKAIDEQIDTVQKRLQATEAAFDRRPSSEKLKKEVAQLYVELENLDAQRVSSTKRLLGIRSTLIKEQTEEELERRKMIDDWLKAIEEEQIERAEKEARVLKDLRIEIAAGKLEGKDKELFLLEQKYKEDLDLYKDNEAIKNALAEKYAQDRYEIDMKYLDQMKAENAKMTAALMKLDPGKGFALLNRALTPTVGPSPLKAPTQTRAEIDKQVEENLTEELELRKQILMQGTNLVYQIGEALGLSEDQLGVLNNTLGAFEQMVAGNWLAAVATMLGTLISGLGDRTDKFAAQIEEVNRLIEKGNKLIEESQRRGGGEEAYGYSLKQLQEKKRLLEEQIRIAENALRDAQAAFFGIGWQVGKRREELTALEETLIEIENQIAETNQALTDFLSGQVTETTIADVIAQGFREGKTAVDDFAEYMNEKLIEAVMEVFKANILGESMTALQEYIAGALSDKVLTSAEKQEIDARIKALADSNKELWEDLTGALDVGEAPTTGLMGISRQLTEETGAELAGLWRRSADDQRQMRDYTKEGVNHLVAIEQNTFNTVEELKLAVTELRDINTNTKPVYSGDM